MKVEAPETSKMHAAVSSSVPAFLAKLWSMVNEESTDSVIGWTEDNKSFYIRNQSVFSMELLPVYYKHNNMASFVRQLNMYGFRKVLSPMAGSLRNESDEMIFAHPDFVKDAPWGLDNIKRKIPHHKELPHHSSELMARLYSEVKTMKGKQDSLDSHLSKMKRENESLWREVLVLRQKHSKQQQIVNKLIQFLVSFVQPNRGAGTSMGLKRKQLPMLEDGGGQRGGSSAKAPRLSRTFSMDENVAASMDTRSMTSSGNSPGPVIHDVTDQVTSPGSGSVLVGASQLPMNFMASPDRSGSPSTVDWTPVAETLTSPASSGSAVGAGIGGGGGDGGGGGGDIAITPPSQQQTEEEEPDNGEDQQQQQQQQQQKDTTVALAAGDANAEPTPVLCDSLLESIQADLDGLRGLIGSPNWRVDTSSMQNILQDPTILQDPDQAGAAVSGGGGAESEQQLISYNPSLLDLFNAESDELFPDLRGLEEDEEASVPAPAEASAAGAAGTDIDSALQLVSTATPATSGAAAAPASGRNSGLNTPTIEIRSPVFPVPRPPPPAAGGRRSGLNTPTIEAPRTPFPAPPRPVSKAETKRRK